MKTLASMHICTGSHKPLLFVDAISTKIASASLMMFQESDLAKLGSEAFCFTSHQQLMSYLGRSVPTELMLTFGRHIVKAFYFFLPIHSIVQ